MGPVMGPKAFPVHIWPDTPSLRELVASTAPPGSQDPRTKPSHPNELWRKLMIVDSHSSIPIRGSILPGDPDPDHRQSLIFFAPRAWVAWDGSVPLVGAAAVVRFHVACRQAALESRRRSHLVWPWLSLPGPGPYCPKQSRNSDIHSIFRRSRYGSLRV